MGGRDNCVVVDNVSKKFSRSLKRSFVYGLRDIARTCIGLDGGAHLRPSEFWAVREISFELPTGGAVGIIGLNGSGKTTLLRMISGILRPTLGNIHVSGRIAPMLALGAGFKPVLSGRENIFLNLSLLGVSEREIRSRFDAIVDFAELHEAIDAPLGTYSSGMKGRLGFACAVHTNPRILVVDEVLSVGDTQFRVKCRNKINELRREGASLLLVSHSAVLVETLSDECLYLRKGKLIKRGEPREVLKMYEEDSVRQTASRNASKSTQLRNRTNNSAQILLIHSISILTGDGKDLGYWQCGQAGELLIELQSMVVLESISINILIFDLTHHQGETVQFMSSSRDIGWLSVSEGGSAIRLLFPQVGLKPGTYRIKLSVSHGGMHDILDVVDDIRVVVRDVGKGQNCLYYQARSWRYQGAELIYTPDYISQVQEFEDDAED